VFHWRKLYREGRLDVASPATPLVPVRIAEVVSDDRPSAILCAGVIVVEVGRARIRVEGSVDAEALRVILERVGR
jgi:transposase